MHIPALNWCFSAPPSSNICTSSRWLQNMKFRHQQLSHVTYTEDCIKHRAAFICMHPGLCWVVHWMQGAAACHSGLCICSQRLADVLEMKRVQGCWPAKAKRGNKGESKREERNRVCECGGRAALLLRRPDFLSVYMVGLKQQQEWHVMTNSTSLSLSVSL